MAALGKTEVDGVDYSPEGIKEVRNQLITIRDHALDQLGGNDIIKASSYAVFFSHVIAYMSDYLEAVNNNVAKEYQI